MITQERLKQLISYNPENGTFFWIEGRKGHAAFRIAGNQNRRGYWRIKIDQKEYRAASLAWLYMYGEFLALDHINRDPSDNRIRNLRPATPSQNNANRLRPKIHTRPRGVTRITYNGRFQAQVTKNGKTTYLGMYDTELEAHRAYLEKALELHGEFLCVF